MNGVLGESILYRASPAAIFSSINAVVNRVQPIVPEGEVLSFQIDVTVSKLDVPTVEPGVDRVRLPGDKRVGEPVPEFVVGAVSNESPGYFQLICVK